MVDSPQVAGLKVSGMLGKGRIRMLQILTPEQVAPIKLNQLVLLDAALQVTLKAYPRTNPKALVTFLQLAANTRLLEPEDFAAAAKKFSR